MKFALIFLLSFNGFVVFAQGNSADRTAAASTPAPPSDGFLVELIRPLGPYEKTPIDRRLRWKAFKDDTIGAFTLFKEASAAAIIQGLDIPHEWGQGVEGYGKRFANDLAFNGVHQTIAYGAATLFHEDNRYFASGKTTTHARIIHAMLSPFETHREDGRLAFSYSNVLGTVGAGFISRAWDPPSEQGGQHIATAIGLSFLGGAAYNTFREFVPDLVRKLQKR